MAAGRRGRPYQIPEDRTSLRSASVDVDARVGWLLLMSRLHHPNTELALGGRFNSELARAGIQADRSAVSRWESGKVTPRFAVLTAYEQVLELRPGQLSSVVNALRRAYGDGQRAWTPVLDPMSDQFHQRLDSLFDVLLTDEAEGHQWTEFGHYVAASDLVYVHSSVWRELTGRLLHQMARSVRLAYLQRFEAVRILLDHRIAHPWLLQATGDYLSDPAVQIINDPVGVLEISHAPEAAEVLLEKFAETRSEDVFEACVSALAYKVGMGQYDEAQLDRIEAAVLNAIHERTSELSGLEELLVAMPDAARGRLMNASRGLRGHHSLATIAAHGEWVRPDTAKRVSQQLATEVRSQIPAASLYDEDAMTPRMIREALFSARSEHRHYASIALQGSPFRPHLADVLAQELEIAGLDDAMAPRFSRLLRYLAGPQHEERLLQWLKDAPPLVARDMALAVGHLPASEADIGVLVARLTGDQSPLDRALLYGLGMRCDNALRVLAAAPDRPPYIRDAAGWWLRQGGAVLT